MNAIQQENFKLFKLIIDICEKESIPYILLGGTLLGAVRQHGFIPWDDDMDLGFVRNDYETFLKVAPKYLINTEYKLYRDNSDEMAFGFSRLVNTNIKVKTKDDSSDYLFIDIFPLDKLPKHYKMASNLFRFVNIAVNNRCKVDEHSSKRRALIAELIGLLTKIVPLKKLKQIRYDLMVKYEGNGTEKNYNLSSPYPFGTEYFTASELATFENSPFENIQVKIPTGSVHFLERLYGDWQIEPPIDQRRTHLKE